MAQSPEISTKVLEYTSAGLPVLLRRGPLYENLFGRDYAGFVETRDDLARQFVALSNDPGLYFETSRRGVDTIMDFTADRVAERLGDAFRKARGGFGQSAALTTQSPQAQAGHSIQAGGEPRKKLLFAGHKMNFIEPIIAYLRGTGRYEIREDIWQGHTRHDENASRELLAWADIVFCEWCLGNAVWYSKNLRPEQRLVIRLHAQEMGLQFRYDLDWTAVDALISISPQNFEKLKSDHAGHAHKISLVYNGFDTGNFARHRVPEAKFNLGLVGYVPKIKRADLAFDLLERVRRQDPRFHLFILGKQPEDYPWMANRPEEMAWYDEVRETIANSASRHAVTFDPFTDDPAGWYAKIGFLLSMSDHEGSHQAVAEAMASGARPIIRNWFGADMLYPPEQVFQDLDAAAALLIEQFESYDHDGRGRRFAESAAAMFDMSVVGPRIETLLNG